MSKHRAGIAVVGETITIVHADVPDNEADPITILSDTPLKLQTGDRGQALSVLFTRCVNFCEQNALEMVVVKASALPLGGAVKAALLESAEVRGVVIAAMATKTKVKIVKKATISRTFGERKVDEYLKDDPFWDSQTVGVNLKKSSREAAMLILSSRGQ